MTLSAIFLARWLFPVPLPPMKTEILSSLNIDPVNTGLVKAVDKQLEALEAYGLIEFTGRGIIVDWLVFCKFA